jgi:hypothetical protein
LRKRGEAGVERRGGGGEREKKYFEFLFFKSFEFVAFDLFLFFPSRISC